LTSYRSPYIFVARAAKKRPTFCLASLEKRSQSFSFAILISIKCIDRGPASERRGQEQKMPHVYGLRRDQDDFRKRAAALASGELAAHAADVDANACFPEAGVAALARDGFFGLCVSKELGGAGQGPRVFAAVVEELAQGCASTAMIYVMHIAAAQAIAASTKLTRKDEVLRRVAAGEHLTTLAFSERGSRSQFWAPMSSLAENERGFVVSAEKSWVTSARHADSYVSSSQKPGAASPLESTLYLIDRTNPDVRVEGNFDGLGLRGNDSAAVILKQAFVPAGDLLTPLGEGATAMHFVVLPWFSIGTAAMANGLSRAATTATAEHFERTGFAHTGTGLRDLPTLRARLADMSVLTEQARAFLGYTLGEIEEPSDTTGLFVLETRLASIEAALDVTDLAMKACGGAAFSRQLPVERIFRNARAGWVMAPTADHLRDFVGRVMTGLPLF
jgi:alkylation response protein AidB-like acyl-CoA dehydrogenase